MEFEFHSASYLTLLEAILIMKNVLGHLMKVWGYSVVSYWETWHFVLFHCRRVRSWVQ